MSNTENITSDGLQIYDNTAGTFSAVDATTKGDAIGYDSNYTTLGVGSNGSVLVADSSAAEGLAWSSLAGAGDFITISNASASSSSSIEFTDLDFTAYGTYWIQIYGAVPEIDGADLHILVSVDNGSSYLSSGYQYIFNRSNSTGYTSVPYSHAATFGLLADFIGKDTGEGISGFLEIHPSADPSSQSYQCIDHQFLMRGAGGALNADFGSVFNSTSSTIDAIKLQFSSGNIDEGEFYLHGFTVS